MTASSVLTAKLEAEYCPPLDTATFLAILSDYDLSRPTDLEAARQTLDALSRGVDAEEATGFDPSGSSGIRRVEDDSESGQSQRGWSSHTDDTSLSQGMSALDLDGLESLDIAEGRDEEVERQREHLAQVYNTRFENLNDAAKIAVLTETFPGIKPFDIKWTLNKCKGNAAFAIDELLNKVFLEDSGHRYQGIEAFSESELPPRSKRGKSRKKRLTVTDEATSSDLQVQIPPVTESKWKTLAHDVEFISTRTGMPSKQVTFWYHENGGSVPATITAIIEAHNSLHLDSEDATVAVNAQELSLEFPTIPPSHTLAITQLTHPSTAAAHELAKAVIIRPPQQTRPSAPIQIEFRLPPPSLSSLSTTKPKPQSHNAVFSVSDPAAPRPTTTPESSSTKDYIALRNTALTQASHYSRLGNSNPLMYGAASYYAQQGASFSAAARAASSAAADTRVASQSSATELDLHGTSVRDAVRIAREGVTAWWMGIAGGGGGGVGRAGRAGNGGTHTGYRIVTGKGTHSEGGKGKLGPAVGAMLIREGWKVEAGNGLLIVTGVVAKLKGV